MEGRRPSPPAVNTASHGVTRHTGGRWPRQETIHKEEQPKHHILWQKTEQCKACTIIQDMAETKGQRLTRHNITEYVRHNKTPLDMA